MTEHRAWQSNSTVDSTFALILQVCSAKCVDFLNSCWPLLQAVVKGMGLLENNLLSIQSILSYIFFLWFDSLGKSFARDEETALQQYIS